MALDARIPLMAQGLNLEPRQNALMRVQQMAGAQQQNALRQMQMQQLQQAMLQEAEQRKAQAAREQEMQGYLSSLSGQSGPPQPFNPAEAIQRTGSVDMAAKLQSLLQPKASEGFTLTPGAVRYGPDGKQVAAAPVKPPEDPEILRMATLLQSMPPNDPRRAIVEAAIRKQTTHAPGTSVNVNTGQKGYDNESKLRNDFKSEPIYKDFQDMRGAHAQIKTAIQQGTPIADTAAATKIMKILDPGSVVRESELAIAMAAAGKLDRLQNYVQMQISGNKLTPQQRKDFGALADELMVAATQAYNAKRSEYEGFGKKYGLDAQVLGPAAAQPSSKPAAALTPSEAAELEQLRKRFGKAP